MFYTFNLLKAFRFKNIAPVLIRYACDKYGSPAVKKDDFCFLYTIGEIPKKHSNTDDKITYNSDFIELIKILDDNFIVNSGCKHGETIVIRN